MYLPYKKGLIKFQHQGLNISVVNFTWNHAGPFLKNEKYNFAKGMKRL